MIETLIENLNEYKTQKAFESYDFGAGTTPYLSNSIHIASFFSPLIVSRRNEFSRGVIAGRNSSTMVKNVLISILRFLHLSSCNNSHVFNLYHHKSVRPGLFQNLRFLTFVFKVC